MPFILRKITRSRWYGRDEHAWLAEGEAQADAFKDLQTDKNELSVFQVRDIESDLNKVITALAANRDTIANLDYALFEQSLLSETGISFENKPGVTPCEEVNALHLNLLELTGTKLNRLAGIIMANSIRKRIPENQVHTLLREGLASGLISQSQVNEALRAKVMPA